MLDKKKIRITFRHVTGTIRDFLLSNKSREFLIFLFFFFVSTVFWLLQTLNYDYETEFAIPLRLKNVPEDVVLTLPPPQEVRFTVQDKGAVLMNYMFGQSFYPLTIDFTEYSQTKDRIRIHSGNLQKSIASQLASSSKINAVKPDTIDIIYTKGKALKVPVKLSGKYTAGQQYYISKVVCQPDSIVVFAPEEMTDTIHAVYTEPIALTEITDTTQTRIALKTIKGAKFVPNFVDIKFFVDIYTDKTVEVPIKGVGFPMDKSLKAFPSKAKVTFRIGMSHFKEITNEQFSIEIPYNDLVASPAEKHTLTLTKQPEGISHIRISPKEIDFLIEQTTPYGN